MTYTIGAIPLNLTKDLALTGGAFESRARLECEGTCFHLFNGTSISMSGLDIVFGTNATGLSSALVEVPTPQTQGFAGAANVTIVNCKIQSHKFATSNTSLSQAFPLVLHESGATMRLIALQTSTINVDTLTAMQFAAGHVGMGASLLFTLYAFEMRFSSLFCGDLDLDCISFEKHRGMYSISLLDSNLAYSSSTMASISNTALLRFESTPETALRPSVEIQSLIVPSGQQLLFRFADNIYLENVTFNANAALVVASVDLFRARNVTQLASSFRLEPMTFDDVRNITMENITIVGFAAVSRQCALLPIISVGVSTYRTVPNSASITALKATGTFCNSSAFDEFAAGIVSVKDIDHVQLVDSVFDDVRTQRALMVRNASIVSVLSSRFLNARAGSPGLVRIFGADKLRTKLRVENTTFDNIVTQTDSALIASNVVATLRAVNFTSCAEVELQSANTCAALTLDDANWAFNSEVLLEDVLFSENTGNGIARINMASHGTARPLLFRRVRFNANQALTSVCKLSGASDYTLDNVDMFSNTAQSALSFPDNTPITGKANGVCLCGNSVGTDSNCAVMSLLNVSSTSVFVGSDSNCFASVSMMCQRNDCPKRPPALTATTTVKGSSTMDATGTGLRPTTTKTTTTTTTTTTTSKAPKPITATATATDIAKTNNPASTSSIGSKTNGNGSGSKSTISSTKSDAGTAGAVVTPDSAAQDKDMSIWDDPPVIGGLIGGILAFILLVTIAVVVGVIIAKRRAAATETPSTGDVQLSNSISTSNYGSIQSALPTHYGESKFSDLD